MVFIVRLKHGGLLRGREAAKEFVKSRGYFLGRRFSCWALDVRGLNFGLLCRKGFEVVLICRVGSFAIFPVI